MIFKKQNYFILSIMIVLAIISSDMAALDKKFIIVETKDYTISSGTIRRFVRKIKIPGGLSEKEFNDILKNTVLDLDREKKANASQVFAYRYNDNVDKSNIPELIDSQYIGMAIYAPNASWSDAGIKKEKKLFIEINDLYFQPPKIGFKPGDIVKLKSEDGIVKISNSYGSWIDKDIIAFVIENTEAEIIDRRSEPMGDVEFVRYYIRVQHNGIKKEGWIHESNIK